MGIAKIAKLAEGGVNGVVVNLARPRTITLTYQERGLRCSLIAMARFGGAVWGEFIPLLLAGNCRSAPQTFFWMTSNFGSSGEQ